jgi:hypothetical protein
MSTIREREREDFKGILRQAGYAESDFEMEHSERPSASVGPIKGAAAITHKQHLVCKIYPIRRENHWLDEFAKDLAKGIFASEQGH